MKLLGNLTYLKEIIPWSPVLGVTAEVFPLNKLHSGELYTPLSLPQSKVAIPYIFYEEIVLIEAWFYKFFVKGGEEALV
jgi:hypothetical protein